MYDFDVDTLVDYVTPTVSIITNDVIPLVLIPEEFLNDTIICTRTHTYLHMYIHSQYVRMYTRQ